MDPPGKVRRWAPKTPKPKPESKPPKEKITESPFKLLPKLLRKGLITLPPPSDGNPKSPTYDHEEFCYYHQGNGHTTKGCAKLREEIRRLRREGILDKDFRIVPCYRGEGNPDDIVVIQTEKEHLLNDPYKLPCARQDLYSALIGLKHITPTTELNPCYRYCWRYYLKCDYHSGQMGHSVNECGDLSEEIQELIQLGIIVNGIRDKNYEIHRYAPIEVRFPIKNKALLAPLLPVPIADVYPLLLHYRYVEPQIKENCPCLHPFNPEKFCDYHFGKQGHSIEECHQLRIEIGRLIKGGEVQFRANTNGEIRVIIVNPGSVLNVAALNEIHENEDFAVNAVGNNSPSDDDTASSSGPANTAASSSNPANPSTNFEIMDLSSPESQ